MSFQGLTVMVLHYFIFFPMINHLTFSKSHENLLSTQFAIQDFHFLRLVAT